MSTPNLEQAAQINNNLKQIRDDLNKLLIILERNMTISPPEKRRGQSERILTILQAKIDALDRTSPSNIEPKQIDYIFKFNLDSDFRVAYHELLELFNKSHQAQLTLDRLQNKKGMLGTMCNLLDNIAYIFSIGKKYNARRLDNESKKKFYEFYSDVIAFIPEGHLLSSN